MLQTRPSQSVLPLDRAHSATQSQPSAGGSIQIHDFFNKNNLYHGSQYSFRGKHLTELAAAEVIDRVIKRMDSKEIPLNVYLDLSEAFDTLDHTILLHKLNYYGISEPPV